ncbi:MAG TPA: diguanylate cyclase [Anaerolineales bacterium]|nr:diguanylate cyclase [Anaerolineales bacterium]
MGQFISRIKISTLLNVIIATTFIVAAILLIIMVNEEQREQALLDAASKARVMLDRNLATHTYFTRQLKPNVMTLTEPFLSSDYFDPAWMSSTYAVREMDKYFKELSDEDYYYKECAINARNPENEADVYESAFIKELNENPDLVERSDIRMINGKPYFVILRRGEVIEPVCLQCHSTPENAPGDLVKVYGPNRSFGRYVGEVVSAISIRIPLETAYVNADRLSLKLTGLLLLILSGLFTIQFWLNRKLLFKPINALHTKALQISTDHSRIGEEIQLPSGRDFAELTRAFNTMSISLRQERDLLDARVKERTSQLNETNNQLHIQMKEIEQLQETLREQARRDPLTGLYNRRYLSESLQQELSRARRARRSVSVIIMDIDHFKKINDTHGHQIGDKFLLEIANLLSTHTRDFDFACRYGGEEFLLVLPNATARNTFKRAEQIRSKCADIRIEHENKDVSITISMGIATYPRHSKNVDELLTKADEALYRSKRRGRNQVTVWKEK